MLNLTRRDSFKKIHNMIIDLIIESIRIAYFIKINEKLTPYLRLNEANRN